jgi:hypothetical protein
MPTTWQNSGHTRGSIRAFCWYLEPSVHCPGDAHPKTSINCVHMIQSVVLWTCLHNHVTAPLPSTNRYRFSTKSVVVSFLRSQAQCPWWLASSYTSASGWTLTTGPRRTNCWGIRSWHWRTWNNCSLIEAVTFIGTEIISAGISAPSRRFHLKVQNSRSTVRWRDTTVALECWIQAWSCLWLAARVLCTCPTLYRVCLVSLVLTLNFSPYLI